MINSNKNTFTISKVELFWLFALFLLIYIEPISLGGVKISQVWKGVLIIFALAHLLPKKLPIYIWFGILFSFKYLLYAKIPYGIFDSLRLFMESLVFPLFLGYLFIKYYVKKNNVDQLVNLALLLSIFLIYSSVPFIFGLESLHTEYDLSEKYNLSLSATKGLFYHIASASKMFTIATVVIIFFRKYFMFNIISKIFWILTVLIGSFLIIMAWTRTGWFIYGASLFIIYFYESKFKTKLLGVASLLVVFMVAGYFYETSDAFRWRLTGGASYREEKTLSFEQLVNARLPYINTAIDNMKEEGFFTTFIGYGELHGRDLFEKKTNMSITSHNATFEILESNGLLGLFLYIVFIYGLYKNTKSKLRYLPKKFKKLFLLITFLFISFYLSSHGTPIWGELIYGCLLIYIISYSKKFQMNEQ